MLYLTVFNMIQDTKTLKDFSIIIPTFNRSKFLKLALKSVLRQKGVSFEVIVGDNCSTDNTKDVVKGFRNSRIIYFKNKKNLGYVQNAHLCYGKASGNYIVNLSDDDFILYDNTLLEVLKVMRKYKVAVGKIGTISYEKSPKTPYRTSILSDNPIVLKPKKNNKIIFKTIDFELGFFSGLFFDNTLVDKSKLIYDMGYVYFPMAFEGILEHGIAFIPRHFIVAHLSLRFWRNYFDIEKFGSFFVEDLFLIVREFVSESEYKEYVEKSVSDGIVMLPNYKYFTNNRNYFKILQIYIRLNKRLFITPKFYLYALGGFLPKSIIKLIRDLIAYKSQIKTFKMLKKYNYFQELRSLGI